MSKKQRTRKNYNYEVYITYFGKVYNFQTDATDKVEAKNTVLEHCEKIEGFIPSYASVLQINEL